MLTSIWIAGKISALMLVAGLVFAHLARPAEARWIKERALPLTIGLYVAGMILPSIWALYLLIVAAIPGLARSRAEAAALYVVTVLAVPSLYLQFGIGSIYVLALDKWLFGAIGMTIAFFILPARGPRPGRWFDLPFYLVMILEIFQARGNNFTGILRVELGVLLSYLLPYFTISRSLRRPNDVRLLLTALCFSAFVLSMVAMFESRGHFLVYEAVNTRLGATASISSYSHARGGMLRAAGSFGEATSFGIFLARALIASLALRDVFRSKRYWLIALGGIVLGLYATNARSALIAMGVGFIAYDLYRRRYQSLVGKVALFSILYAIALLVAQFSPSFAERIGQGATAETTDYRQLLMRRGTEEIMKHPLIGVSPDGAVQALADLRQGEGIVDFVNGYVYYGLTAGIPGVLALLGCFVLTAAQAWRIRKRLLVERRLAQVGGIVFATAITTAITCLTSGFGGRPEVIFYLAVGMVSALTSMRLTSNADIAVSAVAAPDRKRDATTMQPAG